MKAWERWAFGVLTTIVAATGILYGWMKYVIVADDPFAVVNHPWQGAMLAVHVIAAPGLVLVFGMLLNSHILRKLGAGRTPNRRSGLLSLGTFVVMGATGYLLQVVTAPTVLVALVAAHVTSGGLFVAGYVLHLSISVRLSRAHGGRRLRPEVA